MSEWKKFKQSLYEHPGKRIALFLQYLGFIAFVGDGFISGLFGALTMSIFWVPVLYTAWKYR